MSDLPTSTRAVFDAATPKARDGMRALRALIFETAERLNISVEETLRWGQPAYLSPKGTTLRIAVPKTGGAFALLVHCQTPLIEEFRTATGGVFATETNRAILFERASDIDAAALTPFIRAALTYHDRKAS